MKYLSDYINEETTKVLNKFGAFWAFSDKQFKEGAKKGVKYCHLQAGLIAPNDKAEELMKELDKVITAGIKKDLEENTKNGVIKRELYNHEAFYTGDIFNTLESLKSYEITEEEVLKVFNQIKNEKK